RSAKTTANIPVLILTAKDLTPDDFKRLSGNNIQHLIHKGDVDQSTLLLKTKQMLGEKLSGIPDVSAKEMKVASKIAKRDFSKVRSKKITPTILFIEDNPDNMITIKAVLQDRYKIVKATDGEQGLKTALTELPDLVLLDMALPKMDGFELVRKIRDNKAVAAIPVIALTALAMKGDRERIIKAGCDDYVSKPIDEEDMLKKIEEWLEK
ncbi:MAG: response regulator, partial [Desulfobulbaceae bacterium]|nr:response regulator [Desulfobulbaceae bacterium]